MHDGAVLVKGTGFPCQKGANVYFAGHAVGFPGQRAIWSSGTWAGGDETFLTDADGERHTYEVFDKFVVDPGAVRVRRPVKGKSEVSLKTRSLPDYSRRLIVQGKLKSAG